MKKLFSLLVILLAFSCNSSDDETTPISQNPVDVYVAGQKNGQPCYWKNDQLVLLDDGGISGVTATRIIVSNNDVYVFGTTDATTIQLSSSLFWKNGLLTHLNPTLSSETEYAVLISDMDVVGDDVYFVGYTNPAPITLFEPKLATWKNGLKTVVSTNPEGWQDAFIKVKNNTVYITSPTENGYYVNATFYSKPDAVLNGFTENSNDVYVYGGQLLGGFYHNITSNVQTNVGFPNDGSVYKMCFDNNNVYYSDGADIYTNGTLTYSVPMDSNNLFDFTVKDNNLYLIEGHDVNNNPKVVKINNVIAMTSGVEEDFTSLFIVQN